VGVKSVRLGTALIGTHDMPLKALEGESAAHAQDDVTGTALEADYSLDKQTTVYAYLTQLSNGAKGKGTLVSSDNFPAVVNAGDKPRAIGLGVRYNF
jgi:predicted porin